MESQRWRPSLPQPAANSRCRLEGEGVVVPVHFVAAMVVKWPVQLKDGLRLTGYPVLALSLGPAFHPMFLRVAAVRRLPLPVAALLQLRGHRGHCGRPLAPPPCGCRPREHQGEGGQRASHVCSVAAVV